MVQNVAGKVTVITGGASGIGLAIAHRFAAAGAKIVLADINSQTLETAGAEIAAAGAEVLTVVTDVTRLDQIQALAAQATARFGSIDVVCNNAGIGTTPGPTWSRSLEDWEKILAVNLWSVIYGIRTFVPIMLQQGTEGHIVNTASMAGLISVPFGAPYHATKHAVVAVSESLCYDLQLAGAKVKASVLCPGFVATNIGFSGGMPNEELSPLQIQWIEAYQRRITQGIPASEVAERVYQAVIGGQFWILTHPDYKPMVTGRAAQIAAEQNPDVQQVVGRLLE